jgi:hypothetical protein
MATVKRDPLNFFQPFENLPPGHENQLTRALLLVLRLSLIAHAAWLASVVPMRHELQELDEKLAHGGRSIGTSSPRSAPASLRGAAAEASA